MCLIDQNSSLKYDLLFVIAKILKFRSLDGSIRRKKVSNYNNLMNFHFTSGMSYLSLNPIFPTSFRFFILRRL